MSVTLTNRKSTFDANTNADIPVKTTLSGGFNVQSVYPESTSTIATLSNVSASASSVTLLAANASRKGATIVNDSTANLYIKYGSSASATSYTYKLFPSDFYYMKLEDYTSGIITGIWDSATGTARITEMT